MYNPGAPKPIITTEGELAVNSHSALRLEEPTDFLAMLGKWGPVATVVFALALGGYSAVVS